LTGTVWKYFYKFPKWSSANRPLASLSAWRVTRRRGLILRNHAPHLVEIQNTKLLTNVFVFFQTIINVIIIIWYISHFKI
jgi:hypothetical protein